MSTFEEKRVGYLQFSPVLGDVRGNVMRAVERLRSRMAHLVVLPELFTSGYLFLSKDEVAKVAEEIPEGFTTRALCDVAALKNMYIVAGLAEQEEDRYYNSAVLVGPRGYIAKYRKVHLFHEEKSFFEPGDIPFCVHDIGFAQVGMLVCFDWIFPEAARSLALKGMDILCHPANLVLPHCPSAMVTRAVENRIFCITANRTGVEERGAKSLTYIGQSQVVSPVGEILVRASRDGEGLDLVGILPELARNKHVLELNHLFRDRRPEMYDLGAEATGKELS
jgi:predicted amidohydrolase